MSILQRSSVCREWVRIHFLSGHLKKTVRYEHVLDVCCGWGYYLKINPKAWGVDIVPECIEYLSQCGYKVKMCNVIEEDLPFPDATFDLVLMHDAMEHFTLQEAEKILKKVYHILKKGGKFLIVVPNQKGYEYGVRINCGHKHFVTPEEIAMIAKELFVVLKSYPYPLPRVMGKYSIHNKEIITLQKI
mgnify:CR=1 FL=1